MTAQLADRVPVTSTEDVKQKQLEAEARQDTGAWLSHRNPLASLLTRTVYIIAAVLGVLVFISFLMIGLAWLFGARFDVAINELMKGNFRKPSSNAAETLVEKYDHGEL